MFVNLTDSTGDPHFSLYPIRKVEYELASVAEEDPVATWRRGGPIAPCHKLASSTYEPCALPIQTGLQYSHGAGQPEAQRVVTELTNYYHAPSDHVCTLTLGNSDGITKCFRLLGEPGDHFIADEPEDDENGDGVCNTESPATSFPENRETERSEDVEVVA